MPDKESGLVIRLRHRTTGRMIVRRFQARPSRFQRATARFDRWGPACIIVVSIGVFVVALLLSSHPAH
jgi:hypothetical protein